MLGKRPQPAGTQHGATFIGASLLCRLVSFQRRLRRDRGHAGRHGHAGDPIATCGGPLPGSVEWMLRGKRPDRIAQVVGRPCRHHAGFVSWGRSVLSIGIAAGVVCYWDDWPEALFGYDDALDCFGVHALGGIAAVADRGVRVEQSADGGGVLPKAMWQFLNQCMGSHRFVYDRLPA